MDRNIFIKAIWSALKAGQLTPYAYLVGRAMLRRASKAGQLWPSRACLAADVGCSERTVERATAALRDLGVLSWQQRRLRWNRRDTNLYALCTAKPSEKRRESSLESSPAKMSDGSLAAPIAAALARLGAVLGVPTGDVLPWLRA